MFLDSQGQFSDGQALNATAASTNLIDTGVDGNIGIGEAMAVLLVLDVAADDTNSDETYSVALQTDDNSSFSSATQIGSATITRGDAAGTKYVIPIPADQTAERYLRLNYTLGGTTPTVTVTATLIQQSNIDNYVQYDNGYTIS